MKYNVTIETISLKSGLTMKFESKNFADEIEAYEWMERKHYDLLQTDDILEDCDLPGGDGWLVNHMYKLQTTFELKEVE